MFSNTAYEALYQYLGLELHAQFIQAITSEVFFKAVVLIIFGVIFLITTIKFFSRYMPNTLVSKSIFLFQHSSRSSSAFSLAWPF